MGSLEELGAFRTLVGSVSRVLKVKETTKVILRETMVFGRMNTTILNSCAEIETTKVIFNKTILSLLT